MRNAFTMQPTPGNHPAVVDLMRVLVTGSSGHLGEGLVRILRGTPHQIVSLDLAASPFTGTVGSILDRDLVRQCVRATDAVIHTATLHKPHITTHSRQDFIGSKGYRASWQQAQV
jgi:UDP-glucose 4-epimerase